MTFLHRPTASMAYVVECGILRRIALNPNHHYSRTFVRTPVVRKNKSGCVWPHLTKNTRTQTMPPATAAHYDPCPIVSNPEFPSGRTAHSIRPSARCPCPAPRRQSSSQGPPTFDLVKDYAHTHVRKPLRATARILFLALMTLSIAQLS